jgi:hypothetical protein
VPPTADEPPFVLELPAPDEAELPEALPPVLLLPEAAVPPEPDCPPRALDAG